jgi:hypothetical protein
MFDDLEVIPEDKERDNPEYKLHIAVVAHLNSAFIGPHNPNLKFLHIPNQTRNATEAFFNKKMGVLPGASDLLFGWPNSTGVLELKPPGQSLRGNQNKFISWAKLIDWHTGVAWSVKDVHQILQSWGLEASHHTIVEPDYRTKEQKLKQGADLLWKR